MKTALTNNASRQTADRNTPGADSKKSAPSLKSSKSRKQDKATASKAGNTTTNRTDAKARLEARIAQSSHTRIKLAADIQGRTVTDFVINAALEAATRAIEQNFIIQLSLEGQKAFAEALLNPPEPNAALRRAFDRHTKLLKQND